MSAPAAGEPAGGDLLVRGIGRLLTMDPARPGVFKRAAVLVRDGAIAWVGAEDALPAGLPAVEELDVEGAVVLPGFVDAHTHAVWAGQRREELVARISGARYDGGGIASTVGATTEATYDELLALTTARFAAMRANGTTTVEVKSGYALDPDGELRLLAVAAKAAAAVGIGVELTYLGAHAVPVGRDRREYVEEVVATLPAAAAAGARWADVFCDPVGFDHTETKRILLAARAAGLGLRLHVEQTGHTGGAELAAELGCTSADHLEHVDAAGAAALAAAGTVAVLVPVVSLATRSFAWRHAEVLRSAGVRLAIATDCNPGTAWCESMPYAVSLGCLGMGLPVEVALEAATAGGAAALGRADIGVIRAGSRGDLAVLATDHEIDMVTHLGAPAVGGTVVAGRWNSGLDG